MIQGARENAEQYMRRAIIETEYTWKFDQFPDFPTRDVGLTLPRDSVISVSSIVYTDADGSEQTFTDYVTQLSDSFSVIRPTYGKSWPSARGHLGDVTITFKSGYVAEASPTDYRANVPESIKHAILLLVGHMYENREQVVTGTITSEMKFGYERLLWPHRIVKF